MKQTIPNRLPVVIQTRNKVGFLSKEEVYTTVKKCLSPDDITIGTFLYELRSYPKLREFFEPGKTYFLLTEGGVIPPVSMPMAQIYDRYKHEEDDMLYLYLVAENTFG